MRAAEPPGDAPRPFPWEEVMAFGFGVLRLSPDDFWSMSLLEVAAAARGRHGGAASAPAIERAEFEALLRQFPDDASEVSDERF